VDSPLPTWSFVFTNVLSFLLGFGASYLVWYFLQHWVVPGIKFAEELNKYELPAGRFLYRAAFQNSGTRDIIDVEVIVRIGVKEFMGATDWAYHSIKTNSSRIPVLSPGKRRIVRVFDMREPIEFIDAPSLSLRQKIVKCQTLVDILNLGTDGTVQIHVFGYDSFSGSRRHFESKLYRKGDIRLGRYKGLDVVENDKLSKYRAADGVESDSEVA
jgi:hypothetical protein